MLKGSVNSSDDKVLVDELLAVLVAAADRLADWVTCRRPRASPLDFAYAKTHGASRVDDRTKTEVIRMARSKSSRVDVGELLQFLSFQVEEI